MDVRPAEGECRTENRVRNMRRFKSPMAEQRRLDNALRHATISGA